jgi:hypothetical protein
MSQQELAWLVCNVVCPEIKHQTLCEQIPIWSSCKQKRLTIQQVIRKLHYNLQMKMKQKFSTV